jgi:hypothetical protein
MPRRIPPETEGFGNDSFLDVVTNLVGILILLVMVVGLRVKNAPAEPALDAAQTAAFNESVGQATALENDVMRLSGEIEELDLEREFRFHERAAMAYKVAELRNELAARTQQHSAQRDEFSQLLARRTSELALVTQEIERVRATPAKSVQIQSLPTPLSQSVQGHEEHFQLKGGRITRIPLRALLDQFEAEAQRQVNRLRDAPQFSSTVGPVGGFRLRYTLERVDVPGQGSMAQLVEWVLLPVSSQLGESVTTALAEGSEFRETVGALNPRRTTVTIWTYPDSFGEFRKLKQQLFQSGFATAGRPLPEGMPIGGSPQGSRSAAE